MFVQTNRFKKSLGNFPGKGTSSQNAKGRNSRDLRGAKGNGKKSPSNAVFKYSLNGFLNSNRFVKNFRGKETGKTKKHIDLLNKIATGKKRDSKRSKTDKNRRKVAQKGNRLKVCLRTPTTCTRSSKRLGRRKGHPTRRRS